MPLPDPSFDPRRYRDILSETLARIPVHTPEWNNFNDSDPGVTLLQLFSFIAESVVYRANQVPERNRQKFLRLLGIPMRPAQPAVGLVAFGAPATADTAIDLDVNVEVAAGSVPFRTQRGLSVLPVEGHVFFKRRVEGPRRDEIQTLYERLYASIRKPSQQLDFYDTVPLTPASSGAFSRAIDLGAPEVVDGSLWLALVARTVAQRETVRKELAGKILTLGVVPALDADGQTLYPAGPPQVADRPRLTYEIPDVTGQGANYVPLEVSGADDILQAPGLVELVLPSADRLVTWETLGPLEVGVGGYPPSLQDSALVDRLITWIRIRLPQLDGSTEAQGGRVRAALSHVGINMTRVMQRTRVEGERLPDGTGEPDQRARLAKAPVLVDSVLLTVNGVRWQRVEDLSQAGPEVPPRVPRHSSEAALQRTPESAVFVVDRESGEVQFGDGTRGMRPPPGALVVCSYDHGGGRQGVVGVAAVSKGTNLPPGMSVSNPVPTWGGSEPESVADAEQRIPAMLRHRDVLGTVEDYREIVSRTPGVTVGRVEVLSLMHPDLPLDTSEGVVTVMVVPGTAEPDGHAARPDRLFLETVCTYLEPRRVLTTELHVRGPAYKPIAIGVGVRGVPGESEGPLRERVRRAVLEFLSPLVGGFQGNGWPLGRTVELLEVQAAVARVAGVAKVTGVLLVDEGGATLSAGLPLVGIELALVSEVLVAVGEPPTPGTAVTDPVPGASFLPVPVLPEEC